MSCPDILPYGPHRAELALARGSHQGTGKKRKCTKQTAAFTLRFLSSPIFKSLADVKIYLTYKIAAVT